MKSDLLPIKLPKSKDDEIVWAQLYGSSFGLALAQAADQYQGLIVAITPDTPALTRLRQEMSFYTGDTIPIYEFPDWETLPYDLFSPHDDIVSTRLETLFQLSQLKTGILIVSLPNALQRLAPEEYLNQNCLSLSVGQSIGDLESFRLTLEQSGYHYASEVMEHGEFSVRGSIIDLYPAGVSAPYRIDLFDNDIDSIRIFDPKTQRAISKTTQIKIIPAREFPLTESAIALFRSQYRKKFAGNPSEHGIYSDISKGIVPNGIEYYLPLFFPSTTTLFNYLPSSTIIVNFDEYESSADQFLANVYQRYEQRRHDTKRPILPPNELYLDHDSLIAEVKGFPRIVLKRFKTSADDVGRVILDCQTKAPLSLTIQSRTDNPLFALKNFLNEKTRRVLFIAESTGRREYMLDLLRPQAISPTTVESWTAYIHSDIQLAITSAPIEHGLLLTDSPICVITESQLFGGKAHQSKRKTRPSEYTHELIHNLNDLALGSPVVHSEHGVGRYLGLQSLEINAQTGEYLTLEYANKDKLYVPVSSLHLVSRYTGASPENAPLHKLGSEQWQKVKRKAVEQVKDIAIELLDVYARRAAQKGYAYQLDETEYREFCASFPFEETPDQDAAIENVVNDMTSDQPMDRVICGDVGFGKTEVAMRATFVAAQNNKQVAILAPTTLLAQQHYRNFCDRFADWPFKIDVLSRFTGKKDIDKVLDELASGKIDIIIGTHKLIQKKVKYKNLGLLILDEEHRFGVKQKEQLKVMRSNIDVIAMTATPIPRTLNMSLSGLRDLSIIATPPVERVAIKTFVSQWNNVMVQEAVDREINRGGQVFFLHNEVSTIEKQADVVAKLAPNANVRIAHGQMRERELEQTMLDFYHLRFNVLICTTIIESGIDIPTANTIIINRADKLGLAQLHQLRGRVGRSHHRAYAYMITPHTKAMTKDAIKRLEAIESLEDLGSGFMLATHDLEIRGAGELLGDDQSGQIHEIGFSLYSELLDRAVSALKEGKNVDLNKSMDEGPEIEMGLPVLIDADYLPDIHTRLVMYKRIANAKNNEMLRDLQVEMIDRFGLLTENIKNLMKVTAIKLRALKTGISKIVMHANGGKIIFTETPNINPAKIIELIQKQSEKYQMSGQTTLRIDTPLEKPESRFNELHSLLDSIAAD